MSIVFVWDKSRNIYWTKLVFGPFGLPRGPWERHRDEVVDAVAAAVE